MRGTEPSSLSTVVLSGPLLPDVVIKIVRRLHKSKEHLSCLERLRWLVFENDVGMEEFMERAAIFPPPQAVR